MDKTDLIANILQEEKDDHECIIHEFLLNELGTTDFSYSLFFLSISKLIEIRDEIEELIFNK